MKKTLAALAGALVALPVLAAGPQGFAAAPQAQGPKGFDTEPATTVAAVLESGKDHQIVTLRGKFTEHVRGDKVRVVRGKLLGLEGNIVRCESHDSADAANLDIVVQLDILGCARMNISPTDLEKI